MKGQRGATMGGVEVSPSRRKRQAAKRRNEEKSWAAKAGPVTVRKVDDTPSDVPEHDGSSS